MKGGSTCSASAISTSTSSRSVATSVAFTDACLAVLLRSLAAFSPPRHPCPHHSHLMLYPPAMALLCSYKQMLQQAIKLKPPTQFLYQQCNIYQTSSVVHNIAAFRPSLAITACTAKNESGSAHKHGNA